jgi:hypothetical protein
MAFGRREAKIAHLAVVRARMDLVRRGSRQNVALGRESALTDAGDGERFSLELNN